MSNNLNGPRLVRDRSPSGGEEAVARLIRLAGHRPDVPAADAAIVKEAARAEWRRAVRFQKQRMRFYRGAGGLFAAAALALLVVNTGLWRQLWPGSPESLATVETISGAVTASLEDGAAAALGLGDALMTGSVVETGTAPDDGASPPRAAFRLASGTSVRLDAGTRLRLISGSVLALDHGAVYVDTEGDPSARSLEVRTPLGIARDIGTQFEVRLDAEASFLRVRVREGKVELEREDESHTAGAGVQLAILADGTLVEEPIPPYGPDWNWVLAARPPFEVEGLPLGDLLDWAARESGWELRFSDPALAERASSTVLHGSIDGLTPEDAASLFLAGSSLSHRLEDGVFLVEPAE